MSLDVSLKINEPITRRGTGVFIREGGKTKELSPDEVLDRWPEADVTYSQTVTDEVFTLNITHNLTKMADRAGIYMALWRPEENDWKLAKDIIPVLQDGLDQLKANPERFKRYNPSNGWGSYEGLVEGVEAYLEACKKYPQAKIEVSR